MRTLQSWEREGVIWKGTIGSPSEKLVLLALNSFADGSGSSCFPSIGMLERLTELSRRSVIRCLNSLETKGYIAKKNRKTERGNTSNEYRILYESIQMGTRPLTVTPLVSQGHPPGVTVTPPWCQADTPLVSQGHPPSVTVTPDHSNDHSNDQSRESKTRTRENESANSQQPTRHDGEGHLLSQCPIKTLGAGNNPPPIDAQTALSHELDNEVQGECSAPNIQSWLEAYNKNKPERWLFASIGFFTTPTTLDAIQGYTRASGGQNQAIENLVTALQFVRISEDPYWRYLKVSPRTIFNPATLKALEWLGEAQAQGLNPDAVKNSGLSEEAIAAGRLELAAAQLALDNRRTATERLIANALPFGR